MSAVATAVIGGSIVSGFLGADAQSSAADTAAGVQTAANQASIEEQRRQFNEIQKLLKPYIDAGIHASLGLAPYEKAGTDALSVQRDITGLNGVEAQKRAFGVIDSSPEMAAYVKQGENALLQNASATGGLRGGNLEGALATFRPQLLAQLINQQYGRLGGMVGLGSQATTNLAQLGQASAAGTASAGMQSAAAISNALQQSGAAQAGAALAAGQAEANAWGGVGYMGGMLGGMKLTGKF